MDPQHFKSSQKTPQDRVTQSEQPRRKTDNLRIGRFSASGARYFVTLCTAQRQPGLTNPNIADTLINALRRHQKEDDFDLFCATVMPDHIHLLFALKGRLSLPQFVSKFKAQSKSLLESSKLPWQRNFYDHRLRHVTMLETFAFYIFMNPYRKKLLSISTTWPWWVLSKKYNPEFTEALNNGTPQEAWLADTKPLAEIIGHDS